jgi:peptide/nickel transport system ATP-binding protein
MLDVQGVSLEFLSRDGVVRALENVSFSVATGAIVGVVGESGSGKSVTAYALLGILDGSARVVAGRALFEGTDLLAAENSALRHIRGRAIAMIFQNPRASLNPLKPIGEQIAEVFRYTKRAGSRRQARESALALLERMRIADPVRRYTALPLELSGGTCQRVMIAIALAAGPRLLIADEPTTGLDVTTQAAIMDLLVTASRERAMATLLITHDLALAGEYCDRIVVMHAGHVVEAGPTREILRRPRHPYTSRLLATTPQGKSGIADLLPIHGGMPDLRGMLLPCRYSARCEAHGPDCDLPPLPRTAIGADHFVHCHHPR